MLFAVLHHLGIDYCVMHSTLSEENIPHLVRLTQAAMHDHTIAIKELSLHKSSFIAIDRAYINCQQFESFTQSGVFYITKMKKPYLFYCSRQLR